MSKLKAAVAACILGFTCVGCTNYYKVTDPTTSKTYYTTELNQKGNGSSTLKDGRTGAMVNIQNSEVHKISKEEYESGRFAAQEPTPKPAENPFK